jgi:hypothetical protein
MFWCGSLSPALRMPRRPGGHLDAPLEQAVPLDSARKPQSRSEIRSGVEWRRRQKSDFIVWTCNQQVQDNNHTLNKGSSVQDRKSTAEYLSNGGITKACLDEAGDSLCRRVVDQSPEEGGGIGAGSPGTSSGEVLLKRRLVYEH